MTLTCPVCRSGRKRCDVGLAASSHLQMSAARRPRGFDACLHLVLIRIKVTTKFQSGLANDSSYVCDCDIARLCAG